MLEYSGGCCLPHPICPHMFLHYWNIVATFCNQGSSRISPESAKMLMENMQILNAQAFCTDEQLTRELIEMEYGPTNQPLGVPLIPSQTECFSCGGKLLLRADRPSRLSLYTESLGTVPATHYHKSIIGRAVRWFSSMDTTEKGINVCITITG